ncbi:MAG: hypothetical protein HKP58_02560 [Desulfatitalea sp.]|nr:hypothetical protein [Desulfatitalea sp.]NNJ99272.1 hypothetical protein [Desulfatitalea sp.]
MNSKPVVVPSGLPPVEFEKYAAAVTVYKAADYSSAARQFAAIREQTVNPDMARMALYGLACARIMTANTAKEYHEALGLWRNWLQIAPPEQTRENPTLFGPIVENKLLISNIPIDPNNTNNLQEGTAISGWFISQADEQIRLLKAQLAAANQNLEKQELKNKKLRNEIIRLNKQIKAFETIDQKIQKKKNAIPSSD